MRYIIKLLCIILRIIEEIIMKLIPQYCHEDANIHLPSVCEPTGYFKGLTSATIPQGTDFDLLSGVTAYDKYGDETSFTVSPSEVESCQVGTQTFVYTSEDVTKTRDITVTQIANPTISGIPSETLEVEVGEEFDPLDGVTAVDGNGNTISVTVELVSA